MEQEKISKKLFINCKEAGLLTTIKESDGLSGWQKVQLQFHNLLCKMCKLWGRQSSQINKLVKTAFSTEHYTLPPEKKEKIEKELDQLYS